MGSYPKHLCDGRSSLVANFVDRKVDGCNGGVVLSEIKHKNTVRGVLTRLKMHVKHCGGSGSLTMTVLGSIGVGILP